MKSAYIQYLPAVKSLLMLMFLIGGPQGLSAENTDSTVVFTPGQFFALVRQSHPLAMQAGLQPEMGDAAVRKARGGFDPKLYSDFGQKQFNGSQYYSLLHAGLKVPTWYGLEFNSKFEQNSGLYLNPENRMPDAGLWSAGVSLTLGQGLLIDERRAALRQAEIYRRSAKAEQENMLNELLYDAGKAYWEWFVSANRLQVFGDAYLLAEQRFTALRQTALLGDRPAVDTLEAGIQVQERKLSLEQARLEYRNKTLMLSVYLWTPEGSPLEVSDRTAAPAYPDAANDPNAPEELFSALDSLVGSHPLLRTYAFKIQDLSIEKEWKKEQLKPDLRLNYNPLLNPSAATGPVYSSGNYKWGMTFSMPVLLRKERGDLQITGLKIREAEFQLKDKQQTLLNKARAGVNEYKVSFEQLRFYTRTVQDYESLLNAERSIFEAGESSLFMINAREQSYIQAKLKLIELTARQQTALLNTLYALGALR